jgi:hypothetical protein
VNGAQALVGRLVGAGVDVHNARRARSAAATARLWAQLFGNPLTWDDLADLTPDSLRRTCGHH